MHRLTVTICLFSFALIACSCGGTPTPKIEDAKAPPEEKIDETIPPIDADLDAVLERFGKPTEDTSNAKNRERPKTIFRWLVFMPESIRIVYVAADEERYPKKWKFKEFVKNDPQRSPVKADEALSALAGRDNIIAGIAAKKKAAADRVAARRKADEERREALLPKVTRENYNKIGKGMHAREVEKILGPGKEVASAGSIVIARWEQVTGAFGIGNDVVISITFDGGYVVSKVIKD